jgi:hypothetical protein
MLHSTQSPEPPKLTFEDLIPVFSIEIIIRILWFWTDPQRLTVETGPDPLVKYRCRSDDLEGSLPPSIREEYRSMRHRSWLSDAKIFTSTYNLYVSHHLLAQSPDSKFPPLRVATPPHLSGHIDKLIRRPHPLIHTHGLENIILNMSASHYCTIFNLRLPPFETPTTYQFDYQGAASVLEHCRRLTLIFGDAYNMNPWHDVYYPGWQEAGLRPHICEKGKVIDWILDAAWQNKYLQHIPRIMLKGQVQGWVREKWNGIFEHRVYEVKEMPQYERPSEIYPPECKCKIGCWKFSTEM